jgi:NAD(P)-dependent dehydrogenase (short-subunit alcohol dehydrogenase family)
MDLGLNNAAVLVTGGSSGIGREAALAFAREGARVAITYHSRKEAAEAVADEITRAGGAPFVVPMDLDDKDSVAGRRLVLVSTDLAERGMAGSWAYGAAKAGLHGLVASLQHDLGKDGVLANIVMPGITLENGIHRVIPAELLPSVAAQYTAQRLPEAADVAAAIVFLCSPRTTATTGEIIRVNGGTLTAA